jgi:hypothetical protein
MFKVQIKSYIGWVTVLIASAHVAKLDMENRKKFAMLVFPMRMIPLN